MVLLPSRSYSFLHLFSSIYISNNSIRLALRDVTFRNSYQVFSNIMYVSNNCQNHSTTLNQAEISFSCFIHFSMIFIHNIQYTLAEITQQFESFSQPRVLCKMIKRLMERYGKRQRARQNIGALKTSHPITVYKAPAANHSTPFSR